MSRNGPWAKIRAENAVLRCIVSLLTDEELERLLGRQLGVRCDHSLWLPVVMCAEQNRVGSLDMDIVKSVRKKLAALARGIVVAESGTEGVDCDPEYLHWIAQVNQMREMLLDERIKSV